MAEPEMKIVMKRTADLIPYARNPRKNDSVVNGLAASISEFGFKQPIVLDKDGVIVAGHTRAKAAQKLGLAEVPCVVADDLTPEQVKAYRLLDNKLAEKAEWEPELLALELEEITLDLEPFEVNFGEDTPEASHEVTEDEAPEPQSIAVSQRGDVWILGDHRLMCGDSTDSETVREFTEGQEFPLCLTDPPYCVEYENQERQPGRKTRKQGGDDYRDPTDPATFIKSWIANVPANILVFTDAFNKHFHELSDATREWQLLYECVWVKQHFAFVIGRRFQQKHEPILFFRRKKGLAGNWSVPPTVSTVFEHDKAAANPDHPTPKPLQLWVDLLGFCSMAGDCVYEPFSGSGTTLIACEQLARVCYAIEISPQYVDVAIRRWQKLTGKDAIHEATGDTFNQREAADFSTTTMSAGNGA